MSNQSSFGQGRNDANSGKGPANTNGMSSQQKESYNAGYSSQQKQSNSGSKM